MLEHNQMSTEVNSLDVLEFHPGTGCDLNCVFCFRQGATYGPGYAFISEDCLKNLIDDFVALGGRELIISGGLEPFSRPEVAALAIIWASQAGLEVRVYTNGVAKALSEPQVRNLLAFRTKQVRFSIHAINPHTYHRITCTDSKRVTLYSVFENVKAVMKERPSTGGTGVGIGFLALSENIRELIEAAEFWRNMGVNFFDLRFDSATERSAGREISQEVSHFRCLADLGHFCPMRVNIGDYAHGKPCFASQCYAPFQKLVVDPFGMVWSCCLQAQPSYRPTWAKLGDLETDSLSDVMRQIRKRFPRPHCEQCTPWEAKCNLRQEKLDRSETAIRAVSADTL